MTNNSVSDDATILLPRAHFAPMTDYYLSNGQYGGFRRDGSFLNYVIEELIALSASRVAIFEDAAAMRYVDMVPKNVRNRILILEQKHIRSAVEFREGLFGPIFREFGMKNLHPNEFTVEEVRHNGVSEPIMEACCYLYSEMSTFLLGMDQKLWVDVDHSVLTAHAKTLRAYCKDSQSRMNLASLEGLLRTYTTLDAPMLRAISSARPGSIESFRKLLEDEAYQELSREASSLGIPSRARRALTLMRRSIKRIVLKPGFRHVFDVGAKAITIATKLPMPGSGIADSLKQSGFLPPIVNLKESINQAFQIWKGQRPGVKEFYFYRAERPVFVDPRTLKKSNNE